MPPTREPLEAISQRLDIFLADRRAEAAAIGPLAAGFSDATAGAIRGGKRLRARFCIEGWRAVAERDAPDATPDETIISAAAALEVFHAAALVHDDLIDNSDTRRGRPAMHRAVEAWHEREAWHGDAAGFGRSGAILSGDLLVAWSDDLLESGLATAPVGPAAVARRQYARMRREVTIGQFLDVAEEHAFVTAPDGEHAERALSVASYKSARYSIQRPLLIGAALAGADDVQTRALSAFGHPLGMAFQLRDDVLGVFGDESVTGKPAGDDIREGKRTVLVAYAREALDAPARRAFDRLLGDPGLPAAAVLDAQATIRRTGALDRVEARISAYVAAAETAVEGAPLAAGALDRLRSLAELSTNRVT